MSAEGEPLRVALVHHAYRSPPAAGEKDLVHTLASALRDAGQAPSVLTTHHRTTERTIRDGIEVVRARQLPEGLLRQRGFTGPVTHLPATVRVLLGAGYDVVHAFSPPDALAARIWRACGGGPVVFSAAEPVERRRLADRRLRLWLVERAVEDSDAVVAPSAEARSDLWRWLAADAAVIYPGDAAAHVDAYRSLIAARAR